MTNGCEVQSESSEAWAVCLVSLTVDLKSQTAWSVVLKFHLHSILQSSVKHSIIGLCYCIQYVQFSDASVQYGPLGLTLICTSLDKSIAHIWLCKSDKAWQSVLYGFYSPVLDWRAKDYIILTAHDCHILFIITVFVSAHDTWHVYVTRILHCVHVGPPPSSEDFYCRSWGRMVNLTALQIQISFFFC